MPNQPHKPSPAPAPQPLTTAPAVAQAIALHQLHERSEDFRHLLTHLLLPIDMMVVHGIDPVTMRNEQGEVMVEVAEAEEGAVWGLRLLNDIDRRDPLLEIEMTDTSFGRISVTWVGINDPKSPRFEIDRHASGELTLRGKAERHLEAEGAALIAGLAPGQVRAGLGLFRRLLGNLEQFFAALHHYEYEVEPLFYHNAILFERNGFYYIKGRERMRRIHQELAPGGALWQRLDGSTSFRDPLLAQSIRGRSWAIHDGILDDLWDGIKLAKRLGVDAQEDTAPGVAW